MKKLGNAETTEKKSDSRGHPVMAKLYPCLCTVLVVSYLVSEPSFPGLHRV